MAALWQWFDQIRCINLVSRPDKYKQTSEVFEQLQIPVKWLKVEKDASNPERGCFSSHIQVINEAYNDGAETLLVFEDDAVPTEYFSREKLQEAIDFMKDDPEWELFYLGMSPEIFRHRIRWLRGHLFKVNSYGMHAYVIHRRFMEKMRNAEYTGTPIDLLCVNSKRAYALYPSMFTQRFCSSDINEQLLLNKLPFKELIFRLREVYAVYVRQTIDVIALISFFGFLAVIILLIVNPKQKWAWLVGILGLMVIACLFI